MLDRRLRLLISYFVLLVAKNQIVLPFLALKKAAQAYALVKARAFVTPDDVQAVFVAVTAHRIGLGEAETEQLMKQVKVH